ncbi:MAG: alpha-2-macroglobulin family protein [Microscillaceae bacterium]|nr:alpha-2-macroglobulin family protein [Microscillaceae bacterium]
MSKKLFFFEDYYEKAWKEVDSLERKGLPQSALEVVNKIYQKAKSDKNDGQLIKAVMYRIKFMAFIEEDALVKSIQTLQNEAETVAFPANALLHSMLAEAYWQYYQNNRYVFYDRSTTVDFKADDIQTWDLQKIVEESIRQHQLALQETERLKTVKVDHYQPVLHSGETELRKWRATAYDFIAHRALDFFMNQEAELTKPAYQFTLNETKYLSDAADFAKLDIQSKDTLSFEYQAIHLFQNLLTYHLTDSDIGAWLDVDLKRIKYIYPKMNVPNKDQIYLDALNRLKTRCATHPLSAEIDHLIARYYYNEGAKYNPLLSESHKGDIQKALEICQKAIQAFPNSGGAQNCKSLQATISNKSIRIQSEDILPGNQPAPVLIEYRNLKKVYWKVVKANPQGLEKALKRNESDYWEKYIDFYNTQPIVISWNTELPVDEDYQMHRVEEKMPALPFGDYVIFASDDGKFSYKNHAVSHHPIRISNLSYIFRNHRETGTGEVFVLDRVNGEPVSEVKAEVYYSEYNYNSQKYEEKLVGTFYTDKQGFFRIPEQNQNRNYSITLSKGSDLLPGRNQDYIYLYKSTREERLYTNTHFFLDRAIYRPGQTVYFKGIVLEHQGGRHEILPHFKTTVYLFDVNYQRVAELALTTNEFGTFSGSFTAPDNGINGQMHLENIATEAISETNHTVASGQTIYSIAQQYNVSIQEIKQWNNLKSNDIQVGQILKINISRNTNVLGTAYFSVEEYKRPKFEVTFEPVTGSYRLNDEVKVTLQAKAFSGANIDGADVKYRVVRRAIMPYWWYYWRPNFQSSPEMEITNGTAQTDANGKFEVKFQAIPDPSFKKEDFTTFSYTVYVDITDINGETQSNNTSVSVGFQALELGTNLGDEIDRSKGPKWTLYANNLSGQPEKAQGTLTITKLKSPTQAYRSRRWEQPDKFIYAESQWHQLFPYDLYKNENNFAQWEKEKTVLELKFDTEKSKDIPVENLKKWETGKYLVEMTAKDKYGEEVKSMKYFTLFATDAKTIPTPEIEYFQTVKGSGEPGEKALYLAGSHQNIRALYEIEHQGAIVKSEWLTLNNEQQKLEIPLEEKHRGNLSVHYTFIKNNRIYSQSSTIYVPYTHKQLDISFESFRDKLQPGENETWKLRLRGKNGDKVAAEMVATLYDASLDQFRANSWDFNIYNAYYATLQWSSQNNFTFNEHEVYQQDWNPYVGGYNPNYDQLNWFGVGFYYGGYYVAKSVAFGGVRDERRMELERTTAEEPMMEEQVQMELSTNISEILDKKEMDDSVSPSSPNSISPPPPPKEGKKDGEADLTGVKARSNFNETAFFFPHLQTDENGDILVKFTIPEALTRWKMMGFAHTKDLKYGMAGNSLVTQKELMVVPNAPRFLREGDKITLSSKVTNISDKDLEGSAQLFLVDATNAQKIDAQLGNTQAQQTFTVKAGQSIALSWQLHIPEGMQAVTYKVIAKAGSFSDGEEMTLPVLTNRMLVTETLPLPVRGKQTKTFKMDKLLTSSQSNTLSHHKVTLEFTANPAWYAVQALPYMMEFPYECAEQVFSRFYANSLAAHIANSNPKIRAVFDSWKEITPDALLSNLEKNQELKSLVIEETPWVLSAQNESERKHQIGVLFDINYMAKSLKSALDKLAEKQVSSGAWTWFEGMPEDRYLTQHITTGMAHLDHLKVTSVKENAKVQEMIRKALSYLDGVIARDYEELQRLAKQGKIKLSDQHVGHLQIQYLYTRSYYIDLKAEKRTQDAIDYYKGQAAKYWLNFNRYAQGMIALSLHRMSDQLVPKDIIKSLKERALHSEEMGMYWKESYGFYWYEAPIETQAMMIELFDEVAQDAKAVDDLKTWLLKQKQTTDWKTTKATSEACYALLLRGENWLTDKKQITISLGDKKINPYDEANALPTEAGTGYFKTSWNSEDVQAQMGNITVEKQDEGVAWGAVYWQYFEQLDKITTAETPLKLDKKLFLEKNSDTGPVITPITENTTLSVGDKVKVRIELRVDRNMEYVHMKDMRASGFEPINVISHYKYQDGLGYYESTKDAATHFFFGYLPKGTYIFEYPLRVSHAGDFSNGITNIQCMYAPEFSSHSEGIRVKIAEKKP